MTRNTLSRVCGLVVENFPGIRKSPEFEEGREEGRRKEEGGREERKEKYSLWFQLNTVHQDS